MTVRKAAIVGCDEGKAIARTRLGRALDASVPGRCSSPPAKSDGQAGKAAAPSGDDGRARLADVGGHCVMAGAAVGAAALAADQIRAVSAQALQGARSSATRRSRWRRMDDSATKAVDPSALRHGTNREHRELGPAIRGQGDSRPRVMAVGPGGGVTSRRQRKGQTKARRRDARPVRSGGRRGQELGHWPASCGRLGLNDANVVQVWARIADRNFAVGDPVQPDCEVCASLFSTPFYVADASARSQPEPFGQVLL